MKIILIILVLGVVWCSLKHQLGLKVEKSGKSMLGIKQKNRLKHRVRQITWPFLGLRDYPKTIMNHQKYDKSEQDMVIAINNRSIPGTTK